jgi:crotonobetainyl-CoA:carnitine CoA-transferase CaiB-like acyl-CoA transferase
LSDASQGPLTGIRVIDASTVLAGPLACQILGDYGADVIKVEHPRRGDTMRGHGLAKDGHPLWWKMISRNKSCVAIDLSTPEGADLLLRLVVTADVLVENFRPGTLDRWGLSYARLREANSKLVVVRVTAFGQEGPYASRPGFGTLAEAMSGFAAITGEPDGPPTLPPFGLADSISGIAAASATVMALYHRDVHGGDGQEIDLAIVDPMITALGPQPSVFDQLGIVQKRTGNRSVNNAPRNTYLTKDGVWVAISTSATSIAGRVMTLVGHPEVIEEPWFSSGAERAAHGDLLDAYVAEWIAERECADVLAAFERAEAAIAPIYDVAAMMADPQIVARGTIAEVDDADLGPLQMQGLLFKMSETPGSIRHTGRELGADTERVLVDVLGVSDDELDDLRARAIVA